MDDKPEKRQKEYNTADDEHLLTVVECAAYLKLKPSSIYQMVAERRIPHFKIPHSQALRFRKTELDEWLESGRVETVSQYLRRSHKKKGSGDGEAAQEAGQREQVRA